MKRLYAALLLAAALFALPSGALAAARALLVACSDFASQPDLGSAVSGNIHMIASSPACIKIGRNGILNRVCFSRHIEAEAQHHSSRKDRADGIGYILACDIGSRAVDRLVKSASRCAKT